MDIKIRKKDILNNIIINNDITQTLQLNLLQNKKNRPFNNTFNIGKPNGLLIFTWINENKTILYYNYSIFYIVLFNENNIYLNDDLLFQNKIYTVQKFKSISENLFVIYDIDESLNNYEYFLNDNNIFLKKNNEDYPYFAIKS